MPATAVSHRQKPGMPAAEPCLRAARARVQDGVFLLLESVSGMVRIRPDPWSGHVCLPDRFRRWG